MIAQTPIPPYYAVIFTSIRTEVDGGGYLEMANRMEELAKLQPGFLGIESARDDIGITVSYWKDLESIQKWREHIDHTFARKMGRKQWYEAFRVRIALVERDYGFARNN